MKRGSALITDQSRASMVSPLVDVIFNLMITMFVFLMIYMAVAKPVKEIQLHFTRTEMPATKVYSDYFSSIATAGGSGRFTFMLVESGSTHPLHFIKSETGKQIISSTFEKLTDAQGQVLYQSSLHRPETGTLKIASDSGLLQAKFLPGALGASEEAQPVEFEVVVIDNQQTRKVPPALAERWGDVCLHFYQEKPNGRTDSSRKDQGSEQDRTTWESCFIAVRNQSSILVKPQEIPFDPAEQPLQLVESNKVIKGIVGIPLEDTWSIVGGIEPYELTLRGRLPRGLTFDKQTGTITGTPQKPGSLTAELRVKDAQTLPGDWRDARRLRDKVGSPYVTGTLQLDVEPRVPLQARLLVPPYARIGSEPNLMILAKGGIGKNKFEATSLPPGLKIDPNTGEITGSLSEEGNYDIEITITDENPYQDESVVSVKTRNWPVIPPKPSANFVSIGTSRQ